MSPYMAFINTERVRRLHRSIDNVIHTIVEPAEKGLFRIRDELDLLKAGYKLAQYLIHDAERRNLSRYKRDYEKNH